MDLSNLRDSLKQEYKYKIEMHAHTSPASACSQVSPEELIEIYANLNYDAIVITNHLIYEFNLFEKNDIDTAVALYLNDYEKAVKAGEKYKMKVLFGTEIRFTENINDYLVYGVNEKMIREIYELLPYGIESFRKNYSMPESVFIQAHPFRDNMTRIDPSLLDGMETMNMHQGHNSRVAIATRYAKEHNLNIVCAGSDFHQPDINHEGAVSLLSKTLPKDSFELAKILKSGDYVFELGDRAIILP